jgi:hypothetical protein
VTCPTQMIPDIISEKGEFTRKNRRIRSQDVIDELFELFVLKGIPEHIRSDNGPEFTAKVVKKWLDRPRQNAEPIVKILKTWLMSNLYCLFLTRQYPSMLLEFLKKKRFSVEIFKRKD